MHVYEVSLQVDSSVFIEYAAFLGDHIPEVIRAGGFESARWFTAEEPGASASGVQWVIHYLARDRETIDRYIAEHAPRLRAQTEARFAGRFTARRRILEVLSEVTLP